MSRKASRLEALAVLRGELAWWRGRSGNACRALQRAIDVLEGRREPSGPAPSASPPPSDFLKGLLDG